LCRRTVADTCINPAADNPFTGGKAGNGWFSHE
jgi:hypothetical protein